MFNKQKKWLYKQFRKLMLLSFPELEITTSPGKKMIECCYDSKTCGKYVKIYAPAHISETTIGDYTYIAMNSYVSKTSIGRCCSIGPNLVCGWGIHPISAISTHPMFFSSMKQNGMSLSRIDKIEERSPIVIGNDVFIGANVTILDGVTIGDGAIIGAGAVVSKDIPPYAIAVGCPIKIRRYRFDEETIKRLQKIKWWDFDEYHLQDVEKMIFDMSAFLEKYSEKDM